MEEWKEYEEEKLGNYILDIAAGPFGSNLKVECFVPDGFPIIDGANLRGFKVTDNVTKFVTEEKARSLHRSIAKRNDVVVTISGNVGQISYIPADSAYEEYLVSQRQFRATFDINKVNIPYLVYYFHTKEGQHKILSFANQTGVPALAQPLKNFKNIDIVLPPIDIQKRIASILSSLDDKIENNRRINENLEQQAQALFKSWFVDFEPFKDGEFVESDLGMIPTGWRVEQFKDICENITDGVHNSIKDDLSGNYYLLSCKNIKGGFVTIGESERKINKETFEKLRKRTRLQKGDILLSSVGTVGEMVLLNEPPYNYEFQRSVAIIKPNTNLISSHFLYYAMKAQRDEIIHSAHGAVQQCLFISDVANFKTIYPTHEIMQSFTNIVIGLHDKISQNQRESRRLASLRDTLLPKLMSGELKVDEINL